MRSTLCRATGKLVAAVLSFGLVLSLMFSMTSPAFAAGGVIGNLTGTVRDTKTNAPLADVHVSAASPSGSYVATTNASGRFTLLGLPADTYTVTYEKAGYDTISQPGVAVFGDQTNSVGIVKLSSSIKTIVRVTSRARNGAFQPTQTQDVTTVSGARITQTLGSATNTNENNLVLAAPGAMEDSSGNISIRGSFNVELGYQFDGVNFSSPFFDQNGSLGHLNNIQGGTGGSLQLVSGAGDATQGNIGAGVINIVPARGTFPTTGLAAATVGSPFYNHQFDFNYSTASPNGRFSEFFGYDGSNSVPEYSPFGVDASTVGAYYGTAYTKHYDFINNFIYRFGRNNDQSLQLLYRNLDDQQYGNYGGLAGAVYYPYNPLANSLGSSLFNLGNPAPAYPIPESICPSQNTIAPGFGVADPAQIDPANGGGPSPLAWYDCLMHMQGVPPGQTMSNSPEELGYNPTYFMKVGYTRNINPTTFLNAFYYNWNQINGASGLLDGGVNPFLQQVGGRRVGYEADLTHQFGQNHTVTLALQYDDSYPRFTAPQQLYGVLGLLFEDGVGTDPTSNFGMNGQPGLGDFSLPSTAAGLGQPISAANPCTVPNGCYVYNSLVNQGLWNGTMPALPWYGIDMHHSLFQMWGAGLRDQWDVSSKLKLDYGIRVDGAQYKFGPNFFQPTTALAYSNPSDLNPATGFTTQFLKPRIIQPRIAASYLLSPNDALRASYGRSVEFAFAQVAGTPFNLDYVNPLLAQIPAKPGSECGSGYNSSGAAGYSPNPGIPFAGGPVGYYYPCTQNYAQSVFWTIDQQLDAPDIGGQAQTTYNNWDVQYSHQFTKGFMDGWGTKLTGFVRRGYNVTEDTLLQVGPPNPVNGQSSGSVFATQPLGIEKTSGLEFSMTTPDRLTGLSGFLTMDYLSSFSSVPAVAAGSGFATDQLPLLSAYQYGTGVLFRQGYDPPFQGRLGITYKSKSGFRATPIVEFNGGYPIGVGAKTIARVNGVVQFVPSTDLNGALPIGGSVNPGSQYNAWQYADPAYVGSYLNPNIAATRGFAEKDLPGQNLSRPQAFLDLDLAQTFHSGYTLDLYIGNVMDNHYGLPFQNTRYQAVATGVAGPLTGQNNINSNPNSADYQFYQYGQRDEFLPADSYYPFQIQYGAGTTLQLSLEKKL